MLALAITVYKSQGMTLAKFGLNFKDKDLAPGLSHSTTWEFCTRIKAR